MQVHFLVTISAIKFIQQRLTLCAINLHTLYM